VRRQQLLTGFLLMLAAAFVRHAPQCGLLGAWTAEGLRMLLGRDGTTLLVVALAGAAIAVAMPAVVGKILLAAGKLALRSAGTLATRAAAGVRRRRLGASNRARARQPDCRPARTSVPPRPSLPREDELRAALRNLGYTLEEVKWVLPRLDGRTSFDGTIRQALSLLQRAA
jgi:hypothetical protein